MIKTLVAVLTFLLVFGTLSTLGIVYKKTRVSEIPAEAVSLSQPRGTIIADYKTVGQTLYILAKNGGLPDRIIILDPNKPQSQTVINVN